MPHISFKIKAESISTFGTNGLTFYCDFVVIFSSDFSLYIIESSSTVSED